MKKIINLFVLFVVILLAVPVVAAAGPDLYPGDSSIYGGIPEIQPNVLIILDTSGSMNDETLPGDPYDVSVVYPDGNKCGSGNASCQQNHVYKCTAWGQECSNWTDYITDVNKVTTSCGGVNPRNSLLTTGMWNSSAKTLQNDGTCKNSGSGGIYATGNWVNWRSQAGTPQPKIDIAKRVVTNLIASTQGLKIGLMVFNNNQGGSIFSASALGSTYVATIKDMDAIYTAASATTNRYAMMQAVSQITANAWTPLAETLYEAMRYFQGGASAFTNTVGLTSGKYTSPITASCQANYVVIITDGMSTQDSDNVLQTICGNGDCDKDGKDPANDDGTKDPPGTPADSPWFGGTSKNYENQGSDYLDDVAWYMHRNDMNAKYPGSKVTVFTVGFGLGGANAGAVKLLNETAVNGADPDPNTQEPPHAFLSNDEASLTTSLLTIVGKIIQVNTSFVAPVVPVSPENKTFSGSRIYMGFFKPRLGKPWVGNLKKYGIDPVTNEVHGIDFCPITGKPCPATNADGSFKDSAQSYWSSKADAGEVDAGGVGEVLANRDIIANPRKIATYLGSTTDLLDATNLVTQTTITPGMLGFNSGDPVQDANKRTKLVRFIKGFDTYDDNGNQNVTEQREWMLGDILHSKPLVVHYTSYAESDESNCSKNKSLVFVGANDGMLHAFKDCDGSEAWAFIPPDLLPNLSYLRGLSHAYFVDSSTSVYINDVNGNGTIESGEQVIIMFGERRGGGSDISPSGGYYYALDVTNPDSPQYLWNINHNMTDYADMAETWSEPKIVKMKIGGVSSPVAIIGKGYNNLNEDSRYGGNQLFAGTGVVTLTDLGNQTGAAGTSAGTYPPKLPRGKGLYFINVLTGGLIKNLLTPASSGNYSVPGEVAAIDKDGNGFIDTVYFGDTGGNVWRGSVGYSSPDIWYVKQIFRLNPGAGNASDTGHKIFYKPSVAVMDSTKTWLYFGTGDREHPLNRANTERMYGVIDKAQTAAMTEADMVDVTTNVLQLGTTTADQIKTLLAQLNASYGWYIRLDENQGEKCLAPTTLLGGVAYYTTYAPNLTANTDPCQPGNLGIGRMYAVNWDTGEAVINYDASNDNQYDSLAQLNTRAPGPRTRRFCSVATEWLRFLPVSHPGWCRLSRRREMRQVWLARVER